MVASPEPLEILDAPAIATLADAGYVVVGAGGGGIPVVRGPGRRRCAASRPSSTRTSPPRCSRRSVGADVLVIATDVEHVVLGYGTADERPLEPGDRRARCARIAQEHEFASGSMGPKVEAAVRFVEAGGTRSVITSLENIEEAVHGRAGTVIEAREVLTDMASHRQPIEVHKVADRERLRRVRPGPADRRGRHRGRPGHRRHRQDRGQRRRQRLHPDHRRPGLPRGARGQGHPADGRHQADPDRLVRRHRRRHLAARHDLRDHRRRQRCRRPTSRGCRSATR